MRREDDAFVLHQLVREFALSSLQPDAGHRGEVGRLLEQHGDELIGGGAVDAVREAAEALPPPTRGAIVEQILGEAYVHHGRWDDAAAALAHAAGEDDALPPKLAGLLGLAEWERGRPDAALASFQRGHIDGSNIRDEALLLAWMARPLWILGRLDEARSLVDRALAAATAAGDTTTAVRMRLNRTHRLGPREALPEIETALRLAELAGAGPNLAYAFHRRGEAKYYVGRLDDAALDFEQARTLNEQLGSSRSSWDLMYLGDIARERGDLARARTAYEQGLRVAKAGHDAQGMRGSQAGLALVLANEQPDRARELAAEAVAVGRSVGHDVAAALNAAGWIALLTGETDAAAEYAREARAEATAQDFAPHVAEAVELAAMAAAPDPAALEEAATIWRSIGNDLAVARLDLAVARCLRTIGSLAARWYSLRPRHLSRPPIRLATSATPSTRPSSPR